VIVVPVDVNAEKVEVGRDVRVAQQEVQAGCAIEANQSVETGHTKIWLHVALKVGESAGITLYQDSRQF
jgi:hypothetical protein